MNKTDRQILRIALPSIASNITVPLLGLVDTAIVGHMGDAAYIGAIAVGSMIFNVYYWVFGFLRMGTSGMTSQALGRRDLPEVTRLLLRSLAVGGMVALALLVLQRPLFAMALSVIRPSADLLPSVSTYYDICIWGAPAMLGLYGLTGWYIGMQNTRIPMVVAIVQNVVNIAASLSFVYALGMKVEGVALGTLVAQYAGLLCAVVMLVTGYGRLRTYVSWTGIFVRAAMIRFFGVNRDIFLRTLFLVAINLYFLSAGASQGTVVLAVNTLLMQLFTLFSYVMDGFAYAGEALCGRHKGADNGAALGHSVRRLFFWGTSLAAAYTLAYAVGGEPFLCLLTDEAEVISAAGPYFPWAVLIPLAGMAAFIWDGVFIGLTATRGMLVSSALSAVVFFVLYSLLSSSMGNHALWLAFIAYLSARGVAQTVMYRYKMCGVQRP